MCEVARVSGYWTFAKVVGRVGERRLDPLARVDPLCPNCYGFGMSILALPC